MIARNTELARSCMKQLSAASPNLIRNQIPMVDLIKSIPFFQQKVVGINEWFQRFVLDQKLWDSNAFMAASLFTRIFGVSTVEAAMFLAVIYGDPALKAILLAKPNQMFGQHWRLVTKFLKLLDNTEKRRYFSSLPINVTMANILEYSTLLADTPAITGTLAAKCIDSAIQQTNSKIWGTLYSEGVTVLTVLTLELMRVGNIERFDSRAKIE